MSLTLRLLTTLQNATSSQVSPSLAWVASFGPSVIDLIDAPLKSHNRDSDDAGHGSTPTVKKQRLGVSRYILVTSQPNSHPRRALLLMRLLRQAESHMSRLERRDV